MEVQAHHNKIRVLLVATIFIVGLGSVGFGYFFAELTIDKNLISQNTLTLTERVQHLENIVSSVDVYELRLSSLESQAVAHRIGLRTLELQVDDLRADLRVTIAQPIVVTEPVIPADDLREQYYQYGQGQIKPQPN